MCRAPPPPTRRSGPCPFGFAPFPRRELRGDGAEPTPPATGGRRRLPSTPAWRPFLPWGTHPHPPTGGPLAGQPSAPGEPVAARRPPARPAPASPQGQAPPPCPPEPRRRDVYTFIAPQPEGRDQSQRSQAAGGDSAPSPHLPEGEGRGCGRAGPRGAPRRSALSPLTSPQRGAPDTPRQAAHTTHRRGFRLASAPGRARPGRAGQGLRGRARPAPLRGLHTPPGGSQWRRWACAGGPR